SQRLQAELLWQTEDDQRLRTESSLHARESHRFQAELSWQTKETKRLQSELSRQTAEIQRLQTELLRQKEELRLLRNSLSWRLTSPLRFMAITFGISHVVKITRRLIRRAINLQPRDAHETAVIDQMAVIKESDLFDLHWYLEQNTDVAESGINPI